MSNETLKYLVWSCTGSALSGIRHPKNVRSDHVHRTAPHLIEGNEDVYAGKLASESVVTGWRRVSKR